MGNKKIIISCFLLLASYLLGCAPKVTPLPLYKDIDLSLNEVIEIARGDINILKIIAGINVEKGDRSHFYVDAALLLKKPGWIHIRLYIFGMLKGNFLIKGNEVHVLSGRGSSKSEGRLSHNLRQLGKELYYSVFWWEGLEDALMYKQDTEYIIRTKNKEIRLDKSTLLPESQKIIANSKKIYILYGRPKKEVGTTRFRADFWYPSLIKIETGAYMFTVKVEKLFINPPLEENDFKEPEAE